MHIHAWSELTSLHLQHIAWLRPADVDGPREDVDTLTAACRATHGHCLARLRPVVQRLQVGVATHHPVICTCESLLCYPGGNKGMVPARYTQVPSTVLYLLADGAS